MLRLLLLLLLLAFTVSCGQQKKIIHNDDDWVLVWEDDFEDSFELNRNYWNLAERNTADWGNYMSDCAECIEVNDGKLYLRGLNNDNIAPRDTARYLTAGVTTQNKISTTFGKIEIKAKMESATGAWPAIWMLADQPAYGKYPRNGEIDIMEHLNYEDRIFQTVHSYHTLILEEKDNPPYYTTVNVDTEQFNVYGLKWYSDRLVFTLNGEKTFTYPKLKEADEIQWPFDQPFYLLLTMQLGGNWVGEVNPDELPVEMVVDWVRIYEDAGKDF